MEEVKKLIEQEYSAKSFKAFGTVYRFGVKSKVRYWLLGILISLVIVLFMPWTQNIRARGSITTLRQEQRPQQLNSVIAGRITKWYVKEGDIVKKGDTIAQLTEIKDNYLDPQLLERTNDQILAKESSIDFYKTKIASNDAQMVALQETLELKLSQLKLKVVSDSMEAIAAQNALDIADEQYRRQQVMRDSGLVSLVQLEARRQAYQNALAKKMSADVKFINTKTELNQIRQEYAEKIFKVQSDRATAQSDMQNTKAEVSKLNNQYANYRIRNGMYFLVAPQSGQIVQAAKSGINEVIKEGEKIVDIIPLDVDYAVEMYVKPVDLPLLSKGQKVRFLFDGYPAIVFSGWPEASYGTFSGEVFAIESNVSKNGKFRVLIAEDASFKPWPHSLRVGTGASGIALLKDVPVWYELWRNINGFPPDYYIAKDSSVHDTKGYK